MPRSVIHTQEGAKGCHKVWGNIRDCRVKFGRECGHEQLVNVLRINVKKGDPPKLNAGGVHHLASFPIP